MTSIDQFLAVRDVRDVPSTTVLVAENDLATADRDKIRTLLTAAFPGYARLWTTRDFWGGPPDFRLLSRDLTGRLIGHLALARRLIKIDTQSVLIGGIGSVAIFPEMQGQGVGQELLTTLKSILERDVPVDFGFLQCRDAVTGFYERSGFTRINQKVRSFDPDHRIWQVDDAAAMIFPALKPVEAWPSQGIVDLMGMPW